MAGPDSSNPFESTFGLLQAMREEIHELRRCIAKEESQRVREVSEIRQQMVDLERSKNFELDQTVNTVQQLTKSNNARLEKVEVSMEDFRAIKYQGMDMLDAKIDAETVAREHACQALDHAINEDMLISKAYYQKIDKDEAANQRLTADMQEAKNDIERLKQCLCENSMTRDPFKHFHARPGASLQAPVRAARAADAPPGWFTSSVFAPNPRHRFEALLASARPGASDGPPAERAPQPLAEPSPAPRTPDGLAWDRLSATSPAGKIHMPRPASCSSLGKLPGQGVGGLDDDPPLLSPYGRRLGSP